MASSCPINDLPFELLLNILDWLTAYDLESVLGVNDKWNHAIEMIISERYQMKLYHEVPSSTVPVRDISDMVIALRRPDRESYTYGKLSSRYWHICNPDQSTVLHSEDGPANIFYHLDGSVVEKWYEYDRLHRLDGPAEITYFRQELVTDIRGIARPWPQRRVATWYINGVTHRNNGPALIKYDSNGQELFHQWVSGGIVHRNDGPAVIYYHNGRPILEEWVKFGKTHRVDGPACIDYSKDGTKNGEMWYFDGHQHRESGPAVISYYPDGTIKGENWYNEGVLHRVGGPACTLYKIDGSVNCSMWFQKGRRLPENKDPVYPSYPREWNVETLL